MKNRPLGVFISICLAILPRVIAADGVSEAEKTSVIDFTSRWISLVNVGDYAAAYTRMSPAFQKQNTLAGWIEEDKKFVEVAGKTLEQDGLTLGRWERDPQGVEPGVYFLVYASAKFERIDRFRMEITAREEKDGSLHILTYQRMYIDRPTEQALRDLQRKFNGARFPTEKVAVLPPEHRVLPQCWVGPIRSPIFGG